MLTFPSGLLAALDAGAVTEYAMVKFSLPSGDTGVWNGAEQINYAGINYGGLAGNLLVDAIPGTVGLEVESVNVTMGGLTGAALDLIRNQAWHQAPTTVYAGYIDAYANVSYVIPQFVGFIDTGVIQDASGDASTVVLTLETYLRELSRTSSRTQSDYDQRQLGDSNDGFFKWTPASNSNVDIYWGRQGPHSPFGDT